MPHHQAAGPSGGPTDIGHEYFRALYRVVTAVNSSLHLHTVLNLVAEKVAEAMNVKACSLRLLNRATDTLTISAVHGLSQQYLRKGPVKLEKSQLDREVLQGNVVYIRNATLDPRFQYPEEARTEGIATGRSGLGYPLRSAGVTGRRHGAAPSSGTFRNGAGLLGRSRRR